MARSRVDIVRCPFCNVVWSPEEIASDECNSCAWPPIENIPSDGDDDDFDFNPDNNDYE